MNNRVYQYQNIDGLYELSFGAMWLLVGLMATLHVLFPNIYPPLVSLLGFGFGLIGRGAGQLKERFTYPRTGYAMPRVPRYLIFVLFGGLLLINTLDAFFWEGSFSFALIQPLSLGLVTACPLLWMGGGLVRFYYLATAAFVLGAGLTWYGDDMFMGVVLHSSALGLLLLASGGVTLRRYLKEHRPQP